jgi:2-polyprenyl-3-methyl-5-hydroxy-6-metoxy-1,4-benzoquinol methylase
MSLGGKEIIMGDGSRDLQAPWHNFFGKLFTDETILDVGAGMGKSKERLATGNNIVTTQELNSNFKDMVDISTEVSKIKKKFSVVTAFEVLEHTEEYGMDKKTFLKELKRLAKKYIVISTPNAIFIPREWHITPQEFLDLLDEDFQGWEVKFFTRTRANNMDLVEEVDHSEFINNTTSVQVAIMLEKKNVKSKKSGNTN